MIYSPQQEAALKEISTWFKRESKQEQPQPFYLAGYAGTGKTTIAKTIAQGIEGGVLFAAFTGKAASVMSSKGCTDATTIHRLIYTPKGTSSAKLRELVDEKTVAQTEEEKARIQALIEFEKEAMKSMSFVLNPDSPVQDVALVIIDECSMVGERMALDLLSFGVPVLVLGDPAQLPPVKSVGYFTSKPWDFMLDEIHRQAAESGILRLATDMRNGRQFKIGEYGKEARVISIDDLDPDLVMSYDQLLVGRNETRRETNARLRELLGRSSTLPEIDDRLICLKNNHDRGLMNGEMFKVVQHPTFPTEDMVNLTVENYATGQQLYVDAHSQEFQGEEIPYYELSKKVERFDYGYSITVHKSQGSEFPKVIMFDESACFRSSGAQWRYTGVTRASDELLVVLS